MRNRTSSHFRQVTHTVDVPKFVTDFLNSLFDANLDVQHMDQTRGGAHY